MWENQQIQLNSLWTVKFSIRPGWFGLFTAFGSFPQSGCCQVSQHAKQLRSHLNPHKRTAESVQLSVELQLVDSSIGCLTANCWAVLFMTSKMEHKYEAVWFIRVVWWNKPDVHVLYEAWTFSWRFTPIYLTVLGTNEGFYTQTVNQVCRFVLNKTTDEFIDESRHRVKSENKLCTSPSQSSLWQMLHYRWQ